MGAFGRLLEGYFGGTVHDVKTWKNNSSKEETSVFQRERDEHYDMIIKQVIHGKIKIKDLTEEDFYDSDSYDKFMKWADENPKLK